jgi:hypothetical protein
VGSARPGRRTGLFDSVPEGRPRGGPAARRLRRSQAETHGSRGGLPCGCRDISKRPNATTVRGAGPARKTFVQPKPCAAPRIPCSRLLGRYCSANRLNVRVSSPLSLKFGEPSLQSISVHQFEPVWNKLLDEWVCEYPRCEIGGCCEDRFARLIIPT